MTTDYHMTARVKTAKIVTDMYKFLTTSILLRVAVVQTVLIGGALYFIATKMTPEATFTTASGAVRHVFLAPGFIRQVIVGWIVLLPFTYLVTKLVMWVTGKKP